MEIVYALAIGVLAGSGVWLLLRPRTFQVLDGARAAVVRDQSVHLRHGPARNAPRADHRRRQRRRIPRCTRIPCRRRSC